MEHGRYTFARSNIVTQHNIKARVAQSIRMGQGWRSIRRTNKKPPQPLLIHQRAELCQLVKLESNEERKKERRKKAKEGSRRKELKSVCFFNGPGMRNLGVGGSSQFVTGFPSPLFAQPVLRDPLRGK